MAGAATLLVAALVVWLMLPSSSGIPGASRVRQYLDVKACLLTGSDGIAAGQAAAVWAGLQDASLSTKTMVSYQPVIGPPTAAAARPYLASLAERQCHVIVAVDQGPVAAVAADAGRFASIRFVVVAAPAWDRPGQNVTTIPPASAARIRAAVSAAVGAAAQAAT